MNRHRWLLFLILSAQYLIVYFHRVSPAVVAQDLVSSFDISATALGVLASAYFYPYAMMQVPVGILSDSWGPKKTIVVFSLVAAFGAIGFGLAPRFGFAIAARACVGLGLAAVFVSTMRIFGLWFRGAQLARVAGALMAVGGIGWFSATTPLAFLSGLVGWRIAIILVGCASLVVIFFIWRFIEDSPEAKGLPPVVEAGEAVFSGKRNIFDDLAIVLKNKYFWSIAVWFIMRGGALFGFFGLWAGPYLKDVYGLSKGTAGGILSMIAVAMIFVSPIIGHLSDKTLKSRKKILVWSSLLNVLCFACVLYFFDRLGIISLYILFFLMGITISSVGTVAIVTAKELFPGEIAGTSMGMINLFPFIGAIVFQPLMGFVLDRAGMAKGAYPLFAYRQMLWIYFITSVFAFLSILKCKETYQG
ncbi:MAG: MFS transporter [Syntrophorhabdaceae bacterium]|nr:MFS transporter [Syntrophorhabdaceae bacterium]MDD4196733.1 MFS transporter [Syntrophorhabdaceae bacterium]HOC46783.1 MFS transporter [Syntrophorhabdaceae bacterium]